MIIDIEPKNPTLIVNHNTGITYRFKSGGVRCDYRKVEGFILPYEITEYTKFFDADWWKERNLGDVISLMLFVKRSDKESFSKEEIFNKLQNFPKGKMEEWSEWNILINEIEYLYSSLRLNIKKCIKNQESYLNCSLVLNGKYFDGVLTWKNSD